MLVNWPPRYDPFLLQHVREMKDREKHIFNIRYDKINELYNKQHLTTGVTQEELRQAYSIIRSRSFDWEVPTRKEVKKDFCLF